jgi:energy-coupling factor transport system permease protein
VVASGIGCAVAFFVVASRDPAAAVPPYPLDIPQVTVLALVGALLGALPAFLAPPPPDRRAASAAPATAAGEEVAT